MKAIANDNYEPNSGSKTVTLCENTQREPYVPPCMTVLQPSIEGGDTTHVAESQNGLWAS